MHKYPQDWKYGITNSSDLSNIDFTQVYPTDQSGLRYSVDASLTRIKIKRYVNRNKIKKFNRIR
jgi:hypothetical protein